MNPAMFCPEWSLNFTRIRFWGQLIGTMENIGLWSVTSNIKKTIEYIIQRIWRYNYDLKYFGRCEHFEYVIYVMAEIIDVEYVIKKIFVLHTYLKTFTSCYLFLIVLILVHLCAYTFDKLDLELSYFITN